MQRALFSDLPDIPALNELRARRQWVAWKYADRDGVVTKPPVNPHNGYGASHSDPSTWGTYEQAAQWAHDHNLPGVGYVLSDDDDFTGADLDDCRDDDFGGIEPWADEIVRLAETYTEVSPSGRGLRLIWRGKVDRTIKCDPAHVEVYRNKRYLTITGNHLAGTPGEILPAPMTELSLRVRAEQFKPVAPAPDTPKKPGIMSSFAHIMPPGSGSNFFRSINSAALDNLDRWVPELFGSMAEFQPGTRAWRVSSRSLGRSLQEDLSIAPNGIVDFGVHDIGDPRLGKRTPIDIVLEFGSQRTAADAGKWLCERLSVSPASLGWRESGAGSDFPAQEQAKANPAALFEYLDIDQIKTLADPDWLVAGMVVEQALGFIYGPPGCLKTFIALDMALSFTVGMPDWWGRAIERKGAVIYISSEGQADLKFRIQAWEQHNKVLADGSPFFLIRQTINFMKADDVGKLLATVQAIADLTGGPIAAVFVDTVSRVLPGAEENLQKDMTLFVAACDAVRQTFSTTVVGLHHTSRNGNIRGSTVIPGAGDFLIEVRREPGAMEGSIFASKIKSAEDGWEQFFKAEKIDLPGITPRTSLVVSPVDPPKQKEGGPGWPEMDVCRQILAAIAEQWAAGKPWCYAKNTSRSAVVNIMKRWRLKREVVDDMLSTWTANEVISEEVRDTDSHIRGYRKMADI